MTVAEVQRLVDLGILAAREGTGPFLARDARKVRLARACGRWRGFGDRATRRAGCRRSTGWSTNCGASLADNLNPVGRTYSFSTFPSGPNALSQAGGCSLGAQGGEEPVHRLATDAGFTRFRRVAETPFNLVYEARP